MATFRCVIARPIQGGSAASSASTMAANSSSETATLIGCAAKAASARCARSCSHRFWARTSSRSAETLPRNTRAIT